MQPYDEHNGIVLYQGDCREVLAALPEQSVQTIITSPPYFHLRRYTDDEREIGQEPTIAEYVSALVEVFMLCWRVLRDDGTLWLNIGDAYSRGTRSRWTGDAARGAKHRTAWEHYGAGVETDLPSKNLMGLPWRVAFALQDAGWILRSDIVWSKSNAMPESVTDRPTRAHEYLFLFAKTPRYFYNAQAIAEPIKQSSLDRINQPGFDRQTGGAKDYANGTNPNRSMRKTLENFRGKQAGHGRRHAGFNEHYDFNNPSPTRNARTVWGIPTQGLPDEHYAAMPQALAERCIKAGSRPGDTVLDPFAGSGTTGRAAAALQRGAILIDLAYTEMQQRRTDKVQVRMEL